MKEHAVSAALPVRVPVALVRKPAGLSYAEARSSPCATCSTSPCCTHLPLQSFAVRTMVELDRVLYLLGFDRIVVGVSVSGEWSAYYHEACRYLDETAGCSLHGTTAQPAICQNYNPYSCWYRKVLTTDVHPDFVRVDSARLAWILERTAFDEERTIVGVPDWDEMVVAFADLPLAPAAPAERVHPDPVAELWQEVVLGRRPDVPPVVVDGLTAAAGDPCTGCSAPCCDTLVFPVSWPSTVGSLDYLRFCLGFPGVEVGVSDEGWTLVVKTRCRHLEGSRCGIFDSPERPLLCRYYDAHRCTYKASFGTARPDGLVRVRLEQLASLGELFEYDAIGAATGLPPAAAVREHVENGLRAEHALA